MSKNYYVKLRVYPCTICIYVIRDERIVMERRYDLVDLKERDKRHISNFLHFYKEDELRTTWEDLQYLRSIGIRI